MATALLGDDCTFTVSDEVNDFCGGNFGFEMAQLCWEELGITFECPDWTPRPFHKLTFLSMSFEFDVSTHMWVHKISRDKMFSSIVQGGTVRDPPELLQRMNSMRNVCFGDVKTRKELHMLINAFTDYWDAVLEGDSDWETSKMSFVTDANLERLYYGFEDVKIKGMIEPGKFFSGYLEHLGLQGSESSAPGWTKLDGWQV